MIMLLQKKLDSEMWPPDDKPMNVRSSEDSTVSKQGTERTGSVYKIKKALLKTNLQTLAEPGGYTKSDRKSFRSALFKQDTRSVFFKKTSEDELGSLRATVLGKAITHLSMQNQQSGS